MAVQRFGLSIELIRKIDHHREIEKLVFWAAASEQIDSPEQSFGALSSDAKILAFEVQACAEGRILRQSLA